MAHHLGAITVRLTAQVGTNEPVEIGTVDIPVDIIIGSPLASANITLDSQSFRRNLAGAFRQAADHLNE